MHAIIYAPHGLQLSNKTIQELNHPDKVSSICLLSTTKLFQHPPILGGTVNLGLQNTIDLNN
jgi:hypothetical protein